MVETKDSEHAAKMFKALKEKYQNLQFTGHADALDIEDEDEETDEDADSGINGIDHREKKV